MLPVLPNSNSGKEQECDQDANLPFGVPDDDSSIAVENWQHCVHFEVDMFELGRKDGKKLLKPYAVPTLFGKHIRKTKLPSKPLKRSRTAVSDLAASQHDHCYKQRNVPLPKSLKTFDSDDNTELMRPDEGNLQDLTNEEPNMTDETVRTKVTCNDDSPDYDQASLIENFVLPPQQSARTYERIPQQSAHAYERTPQQTAHAYERTPQQSAYTSECTPQQSAYVSKCTPQQSAYTSECTPKQVSSATCDGSCVDKIRRLQDENNYLDIQLAREKEKSMVCEAKLKLLFNEDQLEAMTLDRRKNCQHLNWTEATLKRCLEMKFILGAKGYEYLRECGFPFPSSHMLLERMDRLQYNVETPAEEPLDDILPCYDEASSESNLENEPQNDNLLLFFEDQEGFCQAISI